MQLNAYRRDKIRNFLKIYHHRQGNLSCHHFRDLKVNDEGPFTINLVNINKISNLRNFKGKFLRFNFMYNYLQIPIDFMKRRPRFIFTDNHVNKIYRN